MNEESNPITVLIADDDLDLIHGLCRRMRKSGFNLILAMDGYQAVSLTRKHEPDVIVLDINMPAGDGFSVIERVHELQTKKDAPIICITGERTARIIDRCGELGAYAVLYKPFDTQDLIETIRQAMAGQGV